MSSKISVKPQKPQPAPPLPSIGRVIFYILTFSGAYTADADENELGEGKHHLSPLFYAGQDVITQIRLNTPKRKWPTGKSHSPKMQEP